MKKILIFLVLLPLLVMGQSRPMGKSGQTYLWRLQWLGGPTVLLELGSFRLLTDPMLGPQGDSAFIIPQHPATGKRQVPIRRFTAGPEVDLPPLHAVLLSHLHADHFDRTARQQLNENTLVVAPPSVHTQLTADGFNRLEGIDWGESFELVEVGERLLITAMKAVHTEDSALNASLGKVNGYLLRYTRGDRHFTLYWTGDTVWQEEFAAIKARTGEVDLLLPHLGAVGKGGVLGLRSLDARQALRLVKAVEPKLVIPIHHTTFSHYVEPIEAFSKLAGDKGHSYRLVLLREGESYQGETVVPPPRARR
jgi:L-ascorbate metabolism protein UlaG (beta-lactamase superfamily)